MTAKTDAGERAQPDEPTANPLVHSDDSVYAEGADGKSSARRLWWSAAFVIATGAWIAVLYRTHLL